MYPTPCVTYLNLLIPSAEEVQDHCPTPNWWTTPCRSSITVYSKNSQMLSISGGRFFPQRHDAPRRAVRNEQRHVNSSPEGRS